ncbi:LacI family DNA-binding transcriptional regulator [Microbacterium sp. SA39]|uniref:LacI family DNA-binding transcriptional regulator n=1 Tax=Microbacterium sp. SA39 TaxID=1263625 RepID=UPI0005FA62E7|nr:substrate-binding domain-containing protein [Microbacterium sp. SA39]KJQ54501.1 Lactose operon repressor [Microbacterium sp. SA39]
MNGFPQRPTLADVAAEAGVSTVTVSRVVEGSDKVAPKTRDRVQQAMSRIGYFGNAAASNLVSGRASTIGIITSNTADYGYAATIRGIEASAREHDMAVLIAVIEGTSDADIRKAVGTVASHAVAGVIVIDFDSAGHTILPALPAYLPVVSTNSPSEDIGGGRPYVSMDEYEGGAMMAEHLIAEGHRSIFILAPPDKRPVERRSLGILDALTAARLPHYPVVRCADWQPRSGYDGALELLEQYGEQVTAIACGNDEIALGAIRAVLDRGLRVPEDISITGFDDHPLAAFAVPPLTTIRQDFTSLGRLSFTLLDALIAGSEPHGDQRIAPELIVRGSVAAPNSARGLAIR